MKKPKSKIRMTLIWCNGSENHSPIARVSPVDALTMARMMYEATAVMATAEDILDDDELKETPGELHLAGVRVTEKNYDGWSEIYSEKSDLLCSHQTEPTEVERMVGEAEFTAQEGVRYVQLEGDPSTMDIKELRRQLGYTPPEEDHD